jgi:transcriptional regulator with XRE-family HTH domain
MFNYESVNYTEMSVEQLGDIRDFALLKLEAVSEALRDRVRAEHAEGVEISTLAKKAGVSRNTISQWVK